MIATLLRNDVNSAASESTAAPVPRRACHCCGDEVTAGSIGFVDHRLCCRECHLELVFGLIPEPCSSAPAGRLNGLAADRQYHGGRFHTAEW